MVDIGIQQPNNLVLLLSRFLIEPRKAAKNRQIQHKKRGKKRKNHRKSYKVFFFLVRFKPENVVKVLFVPLIEVGYPQE